MYLLWKISCCKLDSDPFNSDPSSGPFLLPSYQLGSQPSTAMFHSEENGSKGMDPLVLIDAIAICMAYEEKELCKIGEVALAVIFDVASIILGSKERVSQGQQLEGQQLLLVAETIALAENLPLFCITQNKRFFEHHC